MKKRTMKIAKKALCRAFYLLLCLNTVLTFFPVGDVFALKTEFVSRLCFDLGDGETVRAIVLFEGDAGIDLQQKGKAETAAQASSIVLGRQQGMVKTVTETYGAKLVYNYTLLLNGVAVDVNYGNLKQIERLGGIKAVYLANSFASPEESEAPKSVTVGSTDSLGTDSLAGNGAGAVIAVLDTGFNLNHKVFSQTSKLSPTLTAQKLQNIKDSGNLNGGGEYINAKVPYAYDYADKDLSVSTGTNHGTAVASIALGDNGSTFHGAARNAQLLAMKVFSDASGNTDSSIYFNAMEDAYLLGADVINLSFGAQNGFTHDPELEGAVFGNVYKKLKELGVFVVCAAGNEYSEGYKNYAYNRYSNKYGVDAVTSSYADYGVVASPSAYGDNISVAAAENTTHYAYGIKVNGKGVEYFDSAESLYEHFYSNFAGRSLSYEIVSGKGREEDYAGINVKGKIAIVERGGISDSEKLSIAAKKGALGLICYNDSDGIFYLSYSDYVIPSCAISRKSFELFKNAPAKTLTVSTGAMVVDNYLAGTMCDFSSWGVTPDLKLKPNITGIGSGVLCAGSAGTEDFLLMSGTSMAAPVVSGFIAAFIKALPLDDSVSRADRYELVYDLIFSSADTLYYADGVPYSPRKQGVGLPSYKALEGMFAFENPVNNLGDDAAKKGEFKINASLKALYAQDTDTKISYAGAEVVSDNFVYDNKLGATYNTLTPYRLNPTVTLNKQSFSVGKTKSADVQVTITLSEQDKKYLASAENGAFVEGYIYFDYETASGTETIKLTFMGFYGDWIAAPAFEKYDWGEIIDEMVWMLNTVANSATGETYADLGYSVYDMLDMNVGFNAAYLTDSNGEDIGFLGDNLYKNVNFDINRLAFSTAIAKCNHLAEKFTVYPSLLRNAEHVIMTVSNAATGEVYYIDDTMYAIKNFFNQSTGEFEAGTYFQWDGTYLDIFNRVHYVPDNTTVKVTFQTKLAADGAELVTEREYFVRVDYSAPSVNYRWDADSKKLTVMAKDNHYLANVFVYAGDYQTFYVEDAIENSVSGEYYTVTYDLSDANFGSYSSVYLEVQDYATNYKSVTIPLASDSSNISLLLGDVNDDGAIDNQDAVYVLRHDAGLRELDAEQKKRADVNGDGYIDNTDAAIILKYDAGIINRI